MKVLPFILGKSTELSCTKCKKAFGSNEPIDAVTQRRIDIIKDDAQHAWFLYIGYVFIGLAVIALALKD